MSTFNFSICRTDAESRIAQIKGMLAWSPGKVKARLQCSKKDVMRWLKEEEDWLAWINENDGDYVPGAVSSRVLLPVDATPSPSPAFNGGNRD